MKLQNIFALLCVSFCLTGSVGCKPDKNSTAAGTSGAVGHEHDHDHEHTDGEDRDHSVLGHSHGTGPHEGTIVDWGGGKFHVEFTVDHEKREATVYILGTDEKTAVPIDASEVELSIKEPMMQLTLKAAAQDSDPAGKASRFVGGHEKLELVQEYEGTISGVIDGTPYSGDFKEEAHADDH